MQLQVGDLISERYSIREIHETNDTYIAYYTAVDLFLGRTLMLKLLLEYEDKHFYARFEQEAKLLARIEHPHILPIYDFGKYGEFPYQVNRLLLHGKISEFIDSKSDYLNTMQALKMIQSIATAIDYIHLLNIAHRSISTRTVVLDNNYEPYIIDFGYALHDETPELLIEFDDPFSSEIDLAREKQFDLYGFGTVIHYIFTKKQIKKENGKTISLLRELRPELPLGIDIVLAKLLVLDGDTSYSSAVSAVDDLYRVFYSGQGDIEGKVFISYARKDSEYVHSLAKELRGVGVDIWIDQDIEPGENWDDSIENALLACDMMLLIATPASLASEYVTHEWSYFMGSGKPVYPFIPKASVPEKMHPRLARVQHVVGADDMMTDIANIVNVLAGGNPIKLGGLTD